MPCRLVIGNLACGMIVGIHCKHPLLGVVKCALRIKATQGPANPRGIQSIEPAERRSRGRSDGA